MKYKNLVFFSLVFILAILVSGCGLQNKNPASNSVVTETSVSDENLNSYTVNIQEFDFDPAVLKIKQGETVTWLNKDIVTHQINTDQFNSNIFATNESFSYTFNNVGNFDYYCDLHPSMKGLIIVE